MDSLIHTVAATEILLDRPPSPASAGSGYAIIGAPPAG